MKFQWLKARQTRYTAYAAVYIAVIISVLGGANFLANRHNKSYDSTANKRFSLSDQTEKIVRGLKQDVKVYYFDRTSEFSRARDLLDRYDNLSTRLHIEYIDPYKKPQLARAMGVRTEGTIFVEAGVKREEAKSLSEEEITGALIRALKTGDRVACVVSGSGERSLDDTNRSGFSEMKGILEKNNYKTQTISLLEKPEVPKECTVLIIPGPTKDYMAPQANAVKTFVENGGRALIMMDPALKMGGQETGDNPELVKLLAGWGVSLNNDLVLDTSGVGQLFGLGPEVPLVSNYGSQPIVREMKGVATVFPLVRSMEVKSADKTSVEMLFETSDNSFATTRLNSPAIELDPKRDKKGPFTLAAAGTYNTGKDGAQGRFVVVGSSSWAGNSFLPARSVGNRDLFLNMMNWLSSDEDLISIRPKEPQDRRLSLTRAQMSRVFYSSVVGLPLLIILGGFGVWWKRR
ncbi:MAG: GldG family protein [Rhodospirillales bacterium]